MVGRKTEMRTLFFNGRHLILNQPIQVPKMQEPSGDLRPDGHFSKSVLSISANLTGNLEPDTGKEDVSIGSPAQGCRNIRHCRLKQNAWAVVPGIREQDFIVRFVLKPAFVKDPFFPISQIGMNKNFITSCSARSVPMPRLPSRSLMDVKPWMHSKQNLHDQEELLETEQTRTGLKGDGISMSSKIDRKFLLFVQVVMNSIPF